MCIFALKLQQVKRSSEASMVGC